MPDNNKNETILITSNAYFPSVGGVENSLKYLADCYLTLGYKVIIVVSDVSVQGQKLPAQEIINGIAVYRYPTFSNVLGVLKYFRIIRSTFFAWKLFAELNKKHNIILTLSRFHTTTLLAKLAKLPSVIYLVPGVAKNQNSNANLVIKNGISQLKMNLSKAWHQTVQKHALKRCDQVLIFSQNMREQIAEILPKFNKLPIVKPGVDHNHFYPAGDKASLRIHNNIPTNRTILVTVGRFVRAKGFDLVIDAMTELPQCHLVMVGDGENMAEIKQQIIDRKLSTRITLVGSQEDTAPYYQLADIFIMSSRYEPLGQTILEGLSSGLPVIAFKGSSVVTATQELLAEDEAVYSNSVNSEGIVECVNRLINDDDLMKDLAETGRIIAITRFSWLTLAKQTLEYKRDGFHHS
jgi:glycosyltransferase involved in cell wall biosynthesis